MEEARDHRGDSAVAVVDKGIQDTRLALLRDHVEVGNGRGDQRTMACFQQHLIPRTAHMDHAVAFDTHRDDKAVVFAQVAMEGFRHLHHTHVEVRGVDDLCGVVGHLGIDGAVVLFHMEVEGLGREFGMEFTGFAVQTGAVVVIDTVGHVR